MRPLFSHAGVQSSFDTNDNTRKQQEFTGTTLIRRVKCLQPKRKLLTSIEATEASTNTGRTAAAALGLP